MSPFTATVENLNYSAGRIPQVFGKYFKNVNPAGYAHNPQKLGSRVYANRMGNGDEALGDLFKSAAADTFSSQKNLLHELLDLRWRRLCR